MGREQGPVGGGVKPAVDEDGHPRVVRRPDDPAGGLQHLIHAGVDVGVIVAPTVFSIKIFPDLILPQRQAGQAHPHDDGADQPVAL